MRTDCLVLNHNGRALLEECLPSVLAAAAACRFPTRVVVIDNASTDDSLPWLRRTHPTVEIVACPNRGLCSFNDVLAARSSPLAVLLNNDVRLEPDALTRLLEPFAARTAEPRPAPARQGAADADVPGHALFFTTPRCYLFDGVTYEGMKTAVRMRWGLVQASAHLPGGAAAQHDASPSASAGAILAVDRRKFLALGGFDPLYLPGRIEDLDLCWRAFQAGWYGLYVPTSVAYHKGAGSFGPAFGAAGCDRLALRNTLLFQWRHLKAPEHRLAAAVGYGLRLLRDLLRAPFRRPADRFEFPRAWRAARQCWNSRAPAGTIPGDVGRERLFFRIFHPTRLFAPARAERAV